LERGGKVAATARNTKALDGLVAGYDDRVLPLDLDVTDEKNVATATGINLQALQHLTRNVHCQANGDL
jgi:NADP-dependent 3-hydroxy acid dehydrogenase YdfG